MARLVHDPELAYRVYRVLLALHDYDEDEVWKMANTEIRKNTNYTRWLAKYVKPLASSIGLTLETVYSKRW